MHSKRDSTTNKFTKIINEASTFYKYEQWCKTIIFLI